MPRIKAANLAEHREQTLTALLDAVDELAGERPAEAISLRDIAERAGVVRTAIYNYASDKNALLRAASERATASTRLLLEAVAADSNRGAAERLEQIVTILLQGAAHDTHRLVTARAMQNALARAEHEEAFAPFRADVQRHVGRVIGQGVQSSEFPTGLDEELTAAMITGVIVAAVSWAAERPTSIEPISIQARNFIRHALDFGRSPTA